MNKRITTFLLMAFVFAFSFGSAKATTATSLSLTNTSGDSVQISVSGEPSNNIRLSFLPPGASSVTNIVIGTTSSSGSFSTVISSGGYGIPQGSPVYVTVNGVQSSTMLWPSYTSSLSLSSSSVGVAIGQSLTVSGSTSLILPVNGMNAVANTVLSGSQLTVTGISSGSGVLWLCGPSVGCKSVSVFVGDQGQAQVSFSDNNFTINQSQSRNIDIYGGTNAGFTVESNSNSAVLYTSIGGTSRIISIYGTSAGTATVKVCSRESSTNCANLVVTVLSTGSDDLSFSQNDLILNPGSTQNITVSGDSSNSYYINSNSNSGIAVATVSGTNISVVGGGNTGSTVIKVCSTSVNNKCGSLRVTIYRNSDTPSATTLSFSQNVVSVSKGDTVNVTVAGGNGNGYVVSSSSDSSIATASVTGNTNIIAVYGVKEGSATITICSSGNSSTCSNIYVSVGAEKQQIYFNPSSVSLKSGESSIININGGNGTEKEIVSGENSSIATATLNSGGNILTLKAGNVSGTLSIKICSTVYTTNCGILSVSVVGSSQVNPTSSTSSKLIKYSNSSKIYLIENNKKRWIKDEATFNYYKYNWLSVETISDSIVYEDGEDLLINATAKTNSYSFTRDLQTGMTGDDVKALQQYLNKNGFVVASSGAGSLGNETTKFGAATRQALIKFQKANNLTPAIGYFGPLTRKLINSK